MSVQGQAYHYEFDPGDTSWMDDAACRGHDVNDFFIERGQTVKPSVRRLCEDCPVRIDCLEYAVERPGLRGRWGGLSQRDIVRLRRERRQSERREGAA